MPALYWTFCLGFLFLSTGVAYGQADARKLFETHCKKCHGELGRPTERGQSLKAPDFTDKKWQDSITDEQIIKSITEGKGKMPSWNKELTPEEIKAVARWVRVLGPRKR
jgi:cytochrome c6